MLKEKVFRSKALALGLAGCFVLLILPFRTLAAQTGVLNGVVFKGDPSQPVKDAVVKIKNTSTGQILMSEPTVDDGKYSIKDIPDGRYQVGVSTPDGDYNCEYEVLIKSGEVAELQLNLEKCKKPVPGLFARPEGVALIVVGGGLAIFGGYHLFKWIATSPDKR